MKPGYVVLTRGTIENQLIPIFGRKDLPELREADCLRFASMKLDEGLAPKTIKNALSIVRCVCSLAGPANWTVVRITGHLTDT